ncbi:MAG: T9SS type A sorting domain-containing protein [Flavobacteriales bacterium]|nr:T9SS type A sorting domain-containing protein [Flavobacteriales bacterium]
MGQVTDIDGNVYNTVVIGTQVWMAENLKTTRLNDGTPVPLVSDYTDWPALTTPGRCWYGNDEAANADTYGAMYNWYTVNTQKLCPTGWHVPTDAEWAELMDLYGGVAAGNALKEAGTAHWAVPNTGATNESGFTALPGGQRGAYGVFDLIGLAGTWWTATAIDIYNPGSYLLVSASGYAGYSNDNKEAGKSIRCMEGDAMDVGDLQHPSIRTDVYPNPAERLVKVECDLQTALLLQVIDIRGRVVMEKEFIRQTEIELQDKGIYLLRLSNDSAVITRKIVIQ